VAAKLVGKLGDRSLYCPLEELQLLQPLEPALVVAALDQSFDRLDRPVLLTHSNEYRRVVTPHLRMLDALVDECLKTWTGGTLCRHRSPPQLCHRLVGQLRPTCGLSVALNLVERLVTGNSHDLVGSGARFRKRGCSGFTESMRGTMR